MNGDLSLQGGKKDQVVAVEMKSMDSRAMPSLDGSICFATGPVVPIPGDPTHDAMLHEFKTAFSGAVDPSKMNYKPPRSILAAHAEHLPDSGGHTPHTITDRSDADLIRLLHTPGMSCHGTPVHTPPPEYTASKRMPVSLMLEGADIMKSLIHSSEHKGHLPMWQTVVQGLYAGIYIGFGGVLLFTVGAQSYEVKAENPGLQKLLIGLFGLPFSLMLIVMTGASLFTSNTMYMPIAWYHGKITVRQWITNWVLSYFGNLGGCLTIAVIAHVCGFFHGNEAAVEAISSYKAHHGWLDAFLRGILANWCVNLAIWQCVAAQDVWGKFVGIVIPISAFTAMGFEHSIANMFMIPMGILLGAPIPVNYFISHNLVPVTLGNIIAGWICMATGYTFIFGKFEVFERNPVTGRMRFLERSNSKAKPANSSAQDNINWIDAKKPMPTPLK